MGFAKWSTRVLALVAMASLMACGQASTVDLKRAEVKTPPVSPAKPGDDDQNNSGLPPVSTPGTSAPKPNPPGRTPIHAYRAVCEYPVLGGLTSLSTQAGPQDFSDSWYFAEAKPGQTTVTRDDQNLSDIERAVLVPQASADVLTVVFTAQRRDFSTQTSIKRIYAAEVNLIHRVGLSRPVAALPAIESRAAYLADRLGLRLRAYGVSADGRFLLVPGPGATLAILDSKTYQTVSVVGLNPGTVFFPRLDGDVLSVLEFDAQAQLFKNSFFRMSGSPGSAATLKLTPIMTTRASNGMSVSMPSVSLGEKRLWIELEPKNLATLSKLMVARADLTTGKVERLEVLASPGAVLFPQAAFVDTGSVQEVVWAEEAVQPIKNPSPLGPLVKVDSAKFLVAEMNGASASNGAGLKRVAEVAYPAKVLSRIEKSGVNRWGRGLLGLYSTPDAKEFLAVLPEDFGNHLFKFEYGQTTRVTQFTCDNPDLVVEMVP